uniref:At4g15545-like C-terminal domain-containing protein n=1 Tax=Zea mays TaxID=4577 RepID=A0A804QQE4_MAIZE
MSPSWKFSKRHLCSRSRKMTAVIILLPGQALQQLQTSLRHQFFLSDEDSAFPTSKSSQISETASSVSEENSQVEPDAPRPPRPHVFLPSYNSTPRRTPPDSPPRRYASVSPPRRHSISVTSMNMFNDRSSGFSSQHSSPFDPPSQTGRTRVDGKEFFRHVRNRLSYEQFGAFLANVKELNAHRQTREDTLRKADEIFGPENKDLYTVFESLITRNIR